MALHLAYRQLNYYFSPPPPPFQLAAPVPRTGLPRRGQLKHPKRFFYSIFVPFHPLPSLVYSAFECYFFTSFSPPTFHVFLIFILLLLFFGNSWRRLKHFPLHPILRKTCFWFSFPPPESNTLFLPTRVLYILYFFMYSFLFDRELFNTPLCISGGKREDKRTRGLEGLPPVFIFFVLLFYFIFCRRVKIFCGGFLFGINAPITKEKRGVKTLLWERHILRIIYIIDLCRKFRIWDPSEHDFGVLIFQNNF